MGECLFKAGHAAVIVEMDAYARGEIAASVAIAPADIAIITNIGDQHLERFGSKQALAFALSEIFIGAEPRSQLLCTAGTAAMIGDDTATAGGRAWGDGRELVSVTDDVLKTISAETRKSFSSSNQINLAFAIKICRIAKHPAQFYY